MGWNVGHENSGAGGMDLPRLTRFLQGPPDISPLPAQTCVTYSQQRSQHEPFKHQTRLCYSFAPVPYPKSLPWPTEPCSIWLLETSLSTPPNPISLVHAGLIAVPPTNHQASASRPLHLCSLIYLAPSPLLYVSSQMPLYQRCLLQLPCVKSGFSHSCCSPCSARSPIFTRCVIWLFLLLLFLCILLPHRMLALWARESCFSHICISSTLSSTCRRDS